MPELPEVETIARQLDEVLVGQRIEKIQVLRQKSFQGEVKLLRGKKIREVRRKAKMVVVRLEGKLSLLVHLKMTGQLIYQSTDDGRWKTKRIVGGHPTLRRSSGQAATIDRIVGGHPTADWIKELPSRHTRVIIELSEGKLFFNDQRVFGWVRLVTDDQLQEIIGGLPPDVVDSNFTFSYLSSVLQNIRTAIKVAILDQKKMGGIGNIYANDALHLARIDPRRPANKLSAREYKALTQAIKKVIKKGIRLGGASESDFVHVSGMGGEYQKHFLVYKQDGKKCKRKGCGGVIKKIKLGGRGTYFCPKCQA